MNEAPDDRQLERTLVAYVIDEATDEVAATLFEAVRLSRELHLWEGFRPSPFDATPEGSLRTVGVGIRFAGSFPEGDRAGLMRLFDHLEAVARTMMVSFEVQLDEEPLGLIAPEGIQPWVAERVRSVAGIERPAD